MIVERKSEKYEINIPISTEIEDVQNIVDYYRYKELTSGYQTEQSEVDELAREINRGWDNKHEFSGS
jgi:hypothetical protein